MFKLLIVSIVLAGTVIAEEAPVCKKCIEVRKYNAEHPENNYFYYDDYVKDQAAKTKNQNSESRIQNTEASGQKKSE